MNELNRISFPFLGRRDHTMATVAVIGGIAVGAAIAALFATKKGRSIKDDFVKRAAALFRPEDIKDKTSLLGNLVEDVRDHVRQSAEGLLGPESKRHNASEINVKSAGTTAWKEPKEKSVFPENKLSAN